ncbi:MAG: response regulator transcription factor [Candidatus Roizmanbacteria bacterium]|nr:response regulator transcription factor [Candidatus Roizmanbacteria bacterium]
MRILVVEDEHRIARTIEKGLKQEGYAVDLAFDGTTGLDLSATEDYDVIVLDRMIPHIDGITLCKTLRNDYHIHTPILILTAKGQIEDKVSGLNAGADDYLTKPFSFEELVARIRALSRRPNVTEKPVLTVADLVLDPATYSVRRDNQSVTLSKKEFALLEYLMKNVNTVLKKEQIIAHVWNYEADILPNTVEVYIANLRKKIDNAFPKKKPLIRTVWGFGYRLGEK